MSEECKNCNENIGCEDCDPGKTTVSAVPLSGGVSALASSKEIMNQFDVRTIIKEWMIKNWYDGLYSEKHGCSCMCDGLAPCGKVEIDDCKAGIARPCDCKEDCKGFHFHIEPKAH